MSFYYASARQPEVIRTIQKDSTYTNQIGQNLSEVLRFSSNNLWIKYNRLCGLFAELAYHGFSSWTNLQTLGEEYTGIIQIDSKYIALPHKFIQLMAIVLEFAGERLLIKMMKNVEREIERNDELMPEPKRKMLQCCSFIVAAIPYVKAMHRTWFYLFGGKYQISKRLTGINYVLIRYWLSVKHSVYGYKVLGLISSLQLALVCAAFMKQTFQVKQTIELEKNRLAATRQRIIRNTENETRTGAKCSLCLEDRQETSCTLCGHLFCWSCILDWLDQKEECPVCRDPITKSTVVYIMNMN